MLESMISENKMAASQSFFYLNPYLTDWTESRKNPENCGSASDSPIYNSKWVMLKNTISEKQNGDQSAILDLTPNLTKWTESRKKTEQVWFCKWLSYLQ